MEEQIARWETAKADRKPPYKEQLAEGAKQAAAHNAGKPAPAQKKEEHSDR
jgi:hypothetical protein